MGVNSENVNIIWNIQSNVWFEEVFYGQIIIFVIVQFFLIRIGFEDENKTLIFPVISTTLYLFLVE